MGDDTWIDLFPNQFDDAHPYPSFNTRDLDTVDDGCMEHLPRLLQNLGGDTLNDDDAGDAEDKKFELVVTHFLGVDHVGHTYGPHDRHMTEKLGQIDDALSYVLDRIDSTPAHSCRAALVFGDHGMSEEGNHGGGTEDEINAALFVHYSQGCDSVDNADILSTTASSGASGASVGSDSAEIHEKVFGSIHQIDLVPTISILLGLPIPYANLGGLVPALLPPARWIVRRRNREGDSDSLLETEAATTIALALNAAQVWNYLDTYSRTANALPAGPMSELKNILDKATDMYRSAMFSSSLGQRQFSHKKDDRGGETGSHGSYQEASILYKLFLSDATELGKRVWTRFDTDGMILGGVILGLALIASFPQWENEFSPAPVEKVRVWLAALFSGFAPQPKRKAMAVVASFHVSLLAEHATALLFMCFHCLALTFSNSYIEAEKDIIMSLLAILCVLIAVRSWLSFYRGCMPGPPDSRSIALGNTSRTNTWWISILVAICSRANVLFVTGHGLDPSIRMHPAHSCAAFLSSVSVLIGLRLWISYIRSRALRGQDFERLSPFADLEAFVDVACLLFLAFSWWEKRLPDHRRNGHQSCLAALSLSLIGVVISIFALPRAPLSTVFKGSTRDNGDCKVQHQVISFLPSLSHFQHIIALLFRAMIFTAATMGPSAASSSVLFILQAWGLCRMTGFSVPERVSLHVFCSGYNCRTDSSFSIRRI